MDHLKVLDLSHEGVLAWIAEVVANRGINQEAANIVGERLVERYRVNSDYADIIVGYRADDSYTQVIEAFLLNQLNISEVERLFYKGSLGNQIFLKSEKAFEHIRWKNAYKVKQSEVDISYDLIARSLAAARAVTPAMAQRIETEIRYAGYIAREERIIRDIQRHENVKIPDDFDYAPIETMTLESREKLTKIRPRTLAQAGRIPGVSPSDLAQLSIVLLKLK